MSKEINDIDITSKVMTQIHTEHIQMKPKIYFFLGSLAAFFGLVLAMVTSAFCISIIYFSLRTGGRMLEYKLETLYALFNWWIPLIAIVGLTVGVLLLRRYEFSYKKNFSLVIFSFILAVLVTGYVLDQTGLTETLSQKGPFHELMGPRLHDGAGFRAGDQSGSVGKGSQQPYRLE